MEKQVGRISLCGAVMLAASLAAIGPVRAASGAIFISSEKDNVITVLDGKTYQQIDVIKTCRRGGNRFQVGSFREERCVDEILEANDDDVQFCDEGCGFNRILSQRHFANRSQQFQRAFWVAFGFENSNAQHG